jgi:hypothetical protein
VSWVVDDESWSGTIALYTIKINFKNYGCILTKVVYIINLKE